MGAFRHLDAAGFTVHSCPGCSSPSHPATGSVLSPGYVLCWRCALEFARWLSRWTNAKGRRGKGHVDGVSFYEAAGRR